MGISTENNKHSTAIAYTAGFLAALLALYLLVILT